MSKKSLIEMNCPNCQIKQNVVIWQSLNVTLEPDAQKKLFNNEINVLNCENCETKTPVPVTLLYHDMEKQFCVMYVPFTNILEDNLRFRFNEKGLPRSSKRERDLDNYLYHPQLVFDLNELNRYIKFREKLFSDYQKN